MTDHDYRLLDFEMLMQRQVDVVGQGALIVASDEKSCQHLDSQER
jgi:hypothetical protein